MKHRFIVLKIDDCKKYLSSEQKDMLVDISETIAKGRGIDGRDTDPHYIIVNEDETYAKEVISLILKNEVKKCEA